ncbi:MAG: hypothetical protein ACLGIC_13955 [Acidimicrobiia bacterium]
MADDANPPSDDERLAQIAGVLADRVESVVPGWIERLVVERVAAWQGEVADGVRAEAVTAGEAARAEVGPAMRGLLATDIDEQTANPLELLRVATHHAHAVLARHGMPPVRRDEFAERSFPADVYDLMPATWGDVDPSLHEPGIAWGAAKAFVHKARRRAEGRT